MHLLTADKLPAGQRLVGSISAQDLSHQLGKVQIFSFPHVFGRGKQLAEAAGLDVSDCILQGLAELKVKYFPFMRSKDPKNRYCVRRVPDTYQAVHSRNEEPTEEAKIATLASVIATELESRKICYSRTLEKYLTYGMPWLPMVLRRLPSLEGDDKLKTLAFISAVALKMNNEFVEYEALRDSNRDMPVSQDTLKRKVILAPELMENFSVQDVQAPQSHPVQGVYTKACR